MKYFLLLLMMLSTAQAQEVIDPDPQDRLDEITSLAERIITLTQKVDPINSIFVCGDRDIKTYNEAIDAFNKIESGGVYLCRGGEFEVTRPAKISRNDCQADNPCIFGAYGEGELPVVHSEGGVLTVETAKHVNIEDINFIGSGASNGIGISERDIVEYVNFDNVGVTNFGTGMYMVPVNKNKSVNVRNSRFALNSVNGFLGGIEDSILENNTFKNSGTGRSGHQIYVSGRGLKNFTVRNNTLRKNAPPGVMCNRGPLVAHGIIDGLKIENNTIIEEKGNTGGGCWGLAVDQGRGWPESFTNLVIRGNTIKYAANMPLGCSNCPGAIIEDNTVTLHGQISSGIFVPTKPEKDGLETIAPIIRNNIINVEGPITTTNTRWAIRVDATDAEVYDNTINHTEQVSRNFHCVEVNGVDIDGNNCVVN